MALSTNLLRARSYIATLCGFLLALGIVLYVERHQPPPVIPLTPQNLGTDFPALPAARALSFQQAIDARIAWQYFVNNTQQSGLVNALDRQPYVSLWSIGDQLMATLAAERLGIIGHAELDRRLTATLQALHALPLAPRRLPWQYYHSTTLAPYPQQDEAGITWSAADIGRLLSALQACRNHYPEHGAAITRLLSAWQLSALFQQRPYAPYALRATPRWQLISRPGEEGLGYRLYLQSALSGLTPSADIILQQPLRGQRTIDVNGVILTEDEQNDTLALPYDEVITLRATRHPLIVMAPYLLAALEYGFSLDNAAVTWRIFQAQQSRYNPDTGKHFIFDAREGSAPSPLSGAPGPQGAVLQLSTQTAFAWDALLALPWSATLRQQAQTLFVPGRGWRDGVRLDGSASPIISATSNALILESLLYQIQGPLLCAYCQSPDATRANRPTGEPTP
ncbi:hypothetical protein A9798_07425 [Edwardsiella hoshinae]|uniref:DUF3131 domain-containing protein n=1 Tax=Edwardsiella hoshinae TaxID=93378 RepID=A0ABN4SW83_9GAMM|nr:DUF3131 domain-containing protein [Edwardsiella hoshinae]AOV96805.1 hypothetical protein A9798_07425 [Edwardsiella hoshinae]